MNNRKFLYELYIEIIISIINDKIKDNKDEHLYNIKKLLRSKDSTVQRMGVELYKEYIK